MLVLQSCGKQPCIWQARSLHDHPDFPSCNFHFLASTELLVTEGCPAHRARNRAEQSQQLQMSYAAVISVSRSGAVSTIQRCQRWSLLSPRCVVLALVAPVRMPCLAWPID
ncbi:unnamed protein product [Ectocarpus sp. 12 AP-2014]